MIYRSKEKKNRKESETRIKISEFYKWYSSNMVDIKSARYFISGLFMFFLDFSSSSFSYISDKMASDYSCTGKGLPS